MSKACDFCRRSNSYVCSAEDHCMQCPVGQKYLEPEKEKEDTK